jgi:hypothetical protein
VKERLWGVEEGVGYSGSGYNLRGRDVEASNQIITKTFLLHQPRVMYLY